MSTAIPQIAAARPQAPASVVSKLLERYAALEKNRIPVRPFAVATPDGRVCPVGAGEPAFTLKLLSARGERAVASFDELSIAEAFMNGDIDIEGDLLQSLRYRAMLSDRRPIRYLMSTYVVAFLTGQVSSDKRWIRSHYDIDPEFFLLWLDPSLRGYSHAFFERDDEPLESGMRRKFEYALKACDIRPGSRVLDIGGGWGSFLEFAGSRGAQVTSITISKVSERFMNEIIRRRGLDCRVVRQHFLEYRSAEPYDAIVNLGVTEHLPDYRRTVENYQRLLKPGGRVYLDFYSGERYGMPSFITKWVYEGNTSPCCFERYMAALARTSLELVELQNDRHNYFLTCKKWAENLEAARETVVARWGMHLYQRFRLYLWAAANSFDTGTLSAHHMVLERPRAAGAR